MSARAREILQQVCSIPTAPFVEQRVAQYVREFVKARPRLRISEDRFGNLLIELPAKSRNDAARWVFTAHMDHPGFIVRRMRDSRTLEADFRGGVDKAYFPGAKVRLFEAERVRATGKLPQYEQVKKADWPRVHQSRRLAQHAGLVRRPRPQGS
jgi:putative aminopeptidase FrvX